MPAALSRDVLRRHRHNAATPVGSIPLDLLSMIFEYTALSLGSHDEINFGLIPSLMRSCASLRHATIHTPFIWSFITFRWCRGPDVVPWCELMSGHLERSRDMDLHITFLVEGDFVHRTEVQLAIKSFKDLILPHLHRCWRLETREEHTTTHFGGHRLPSFFPLEGNMARLESLTFTGYLDYRRVLLGPTLNAPTLRKISCYEGNIFGFGLESFPPGPHALPPTFAIDTLDLVYGELAEFRLGYHALASLIHLTRLRCLRITSMTHVLSRALEFPLLEVLSLQGGFFERDPQGFPASYLIHAPELQHLKYTHEGDNDEMVPSFLASPNFPNLLTFDYHGPHRSVSHPAQGDLERFFNALGTCPALGAISFCFTEFDGWVDVLHRMLVDESRGGEYRWFPELRRMQCSMMKEPATEQAGVQTLVDILKARQLVRVGYIRHPHHVRPHPEWMSGAIQDVMPQWKFTYAEDWTAVFFRT